MGDPRWEASCGWSRFWRTRILRFHLSHGLRLDSVSASFLELYTTYIRGPPSGLRGEQESVLMLMEQRFAGVEATAVSAIHRLFKL